MLKPVVVLCVVLAAGLSQTQPAAVPPMYQAVDSLVWVVRDIDQTVAGWRKLGFDIHVPREVSIDARYRGRPAPSTAKIADGHLGDVAVQWIQPLEGTNAYSDFLARHGIGMFSLVHRASSPDVLTAEVERVNAL